MDDFLMVLIALAVVAFLTKHFCQEKEDDLDERQRRQADEITLRAMETVQALRARAWQARHDMRRIAEADIVDLDDNNRLM